MSWQHLFLTYLTKLSISWNTFLSHHSPPFKQTNCTNRIVLSQAHKLEYNTQTHTHTKAIHTQNATATHTNATMQHMHAHTRNYATHIHMHTHAHTDTNTNPLTSSSKRERLDWVAASLASKTSRCDFLCRLLTPPSCASCHQRGKATWTVRPLWINQQMDLSASYKYRQYTDRVCKWTTGSRTQLLD